MVLPTAKDIVPVYYKSFHLKERIFKTYEGEMILSSVESSDRTTLASEKFFFSVVDTDIAKSMEQIQGEHVVVHYKQKNGALMWRGDSPYIVDSVRISEEPFRKK